MRRHLYHTIILLLTATLFAACTDDPDEGLRQLRFSATIEPLGDEHGAKVYLVDEHWTYWEGYDQINLASDQTTAGSYSDEDNFADLVNAGSGAWEDYNGVFITTLPEDSKYFLGLFPRNAANHIHYTGDRNFAVTINLTGTQPLRSDITFARNVFPMVAWYGGHYDGEEGSTPFNLDFHSLAGIVRLQFFNNAEAKTIDHIEVTSLNGKQLSGQFTVAGYRTYESVRLVEAANNATNQKVTLACGGGLPLGADSLRTFYLVLPATKTMDDSTVHNLQVKVVTTDGKQCVKNCTTYVRRNGITYMRALGIDAWADGSGSGSASPGLVGNGTAERPFKIYSVEELQYLRQAFSTTPVKVNNRAVTADTYFRIMRSNLTLTTSNWISGIANFVGHLDYYGANTSNPVVVNNSEQPLFESIADGGDVHGITLGRSVNTVHTINGDFSYFCHANSGTISECAVRDTLRASTNNEGGFGGICAENNGTISACGCTAVIDCEGGLVGGICYSNHTGGTIASCYAATAMSVTAAFSVAGICHTNQGDVHDSYFACRVESSALDWGGIVYTNGGTVQHCYISTTGHILTTGTVGGIVNAVTGGTVDYCWSDARLQGSVAGLIASSVSGGSVQNCYSRRTGVTVIACASPYHAGGLVGELSGGTIVNSYVYINSVDSYNGQGYVGGIVGVMTGGTIDNSYAYETNPQQRAFYGSKSSGTITNSHLVGGVDEDGITGVSLGAELNTNLATMKEVLSAHHGTYKDWKLLGGPVTVPVHEDY